MLADGLRLGQLHGSELDDETALATIARRLTAVYTDLGDVFRAPYFDLAG